MQELFSNRGVLAKVLPVLGLALGFFLLDLGLTLLHEGGSIAWPIPGAVVAAGSLGLTVRSFR
ncbi:hypothetical protein F4556_002817 [Kitasatospora gansuensis]|uniref:Uncharacterized protein n=1 Tax=Kitasatospora gansuensis TaxID=258050 RepID=A0A7W7SBM2_9ACTN|nr:hypothetical protein [Kitasatospora gansuensis]MBB4947282.1 hypothetical protein [Kitasatospora gansuensis]